MNPNTQRTTLLLTALILPAVLVAVWSSSASTRRKEGVAEASNVAVASVSEDAYCTPQLKAVVRRVAGACGLIEGGGGGRGCQPMEAKKVAALSGDDFNALFKPLSKRAHIVQFDSEKTDLDDGAKALVDRAWADQRGASFFFVVSRASPDGDSATNNALSRDRAQSVLQHLKARFNDPDLDKEVGLLWLGEEFAQLSPEFCGWDRSRQGECSAKEINRSAFVAWIDCAI